MDGGLLFCNSNGNAFRAICNDLYCRNSWRTTRGERCSYSRLPKADTCYAGYCAGEGGG